MELKPDASFRASDGTDPDRVRADIELLNQRMSVLAENIKTLADAMDGIPTKEAGTIEEKITLAEGGGLIETDDGVRLDIMGLPIGASNASGWLVVEGDDGQLYRVPAEDFVTKPAIDNPDDVPTMAAEAGMVSVAWIGNSTTVTRNELYGVAVNVTAELAKIRDVMEPTLQLLRRIGTDGNA